jgi:hypothetical protein
MRRVGIAAVVVVVLIAAIGGGVYMWLTRGLITDPAEVQRMADAMLPGAKPPAGLSAVVALHPEKDLDVAVFAPSLPKARPESLQGSDLRIVIAQPHSTTQPSFDEIRAKIEKAQSRKAEEMATTGKKAALVGVGGRPYPALETTEVLKSGGARFLEYVTIFKHGDNPTVVMIMGPADTFNRKAMDEFLAALPSSTPPAMPDGQRPARAARPARPGAPKGPPPPPLPGP